MKKKLTTLTIGSLLVSGMMLSGCNLLEKDEPVVIDAPKETTYTNKKLSEISSGDKEQMISTDLYVLSEKGYVVPVTVFLPGTEKVAQQTLEYLVQGGKINDVLQSGFTALLPKGTKVLGVNIGKDDTAVVNFNKKFLSYNKDYEKQLLESITWSLTQYENIKKVVLQVEGETLTELPGSKKPLYALTRGIGINHDNGGVADIRNSKTATIYYVTEEDEQSYYVPITKRIKNQENVSMAEQIVDELIAGAGFESKLVTEFNNDVRLNKSSLEKGLLTLDFNQNIYTNPKNKEISTSLIQALVLSLTEQSGIEKVQVLVDGEKTAVSDKGAKLTEPVSRPTHVNTGKF